MVLADPDAMTQVFGNLIENAMKYGKSGGRVRVYAQTLSNAGENMVEFVVQDFGPGMAYEHLNRIFERFYRIDKARSRDSGGTGLGLAIVKHIVQAHGGRIWAESELGSGAAFHFTLPVVVRDALPGTLEGTPPMREPSPSEVALTGSRTASEGKGVQSSPVQSPVTLGADNKERFVAKGIQL